MALEDDTYCYCTLDSRMPFTEYLPYAVDMQEKAKAQKRVSDDADGNELIFVSTLPWFSYTSLVQPVPLPADSNPRITWGKYFRQDGEQWIPVTALCHHGLVDGLHIAGFYQNLEEQIKSMLQRIQ